MSEQEKEVQKQEPPFVVVTTKDGFVFSGFLAGNEKNQTVTLLEARNISFPKDLGVDLRLYLKSDPYGDGTIGFKEVLVNNVTSIMVLEASNVS